MIDTEGRERQGDWMQTNSGVAFWPLDPRIDEIVLDDIAHALAQANRYAGHTKYPFSVAQHSCLVFDWITDQFSDVGLGQWAILHDAPEFVFQDMIGPIKRSMNTGSYRDHYRRLEGLIVDRFGMLPLTVPAEVDEADKRIVLDEQAALMDKPSPLEWSFYRGLSPLGVVIEEWDWRRAKAEFLGRCDAVGLK